MEIGRAGCRQAPGAIHSNLKGRKYFVVIRANVWLPGFFFSNATEGPKHALVHPGLMLHTGIRAGLHEPRLFMP